MVAFVAGGTDLFNQMVFGQPSQNDIAFFNNNFQNFMNANATNGHTSGTAFFNAIKDNIRLPDFNRLKEYANRVTKKLSGIWADDTVIMELPTLVDLQFPNRNMIRWMMANPTVRKLYHANQCEGYGDKYIDLQPGVIGEQHFDYQCVTQGMPIYDEEEENIVWPTYCETFDEPENSVNQLTISEKADIIDSWTHMDYWLKRKQEDPTSQYSAML